MGWRIENGPHIGRWVASNIRGVYHEGDVAIGLLKDDKIIAGVLYENWNGRSLIVHLAIMGRMTPAFLAAIFDYGFNVCGIEKAIAPISSANHKIISLVKKMGYIEEGRIKDADPLGDIVLFTMRRDACRFLGDKYGKKYTSSANAS